MRKFSSFDFSGKMRGITSFYFYFDFNFTYSTIKGRYKTRWEELKNEKGKQNRKMRKFSSFDFNIRMRIILAF